MKAGIFAFVLALALSTTVLADEIGSGRCGYKPSANCFSNFPASTTAVGDSGDDEIGSGKTSTTNTVTPEVTEFSFGNLWMFLKFGYQLNF